MNPNVRPGVFRLVLGIALLKGVFKKIIKPKDRAFFLGILREPNIRLPWGQNVDLLEMIQERVESEMVAKATATSQIIRFDWFTILEALLAMLPGLLEWLKELLDLFDNINYNTVDYEELGGLMLTELEEEVA